MSKRKPLTKDRDSEQFWKELPWIRQICKVKAENPKFQAKRILQETNLKVCTIQLVLLYYVEINVVIIFYGSDRHCL